jgi:predicted short-subunit dehydrogenase-like oxidoreductase (DUF2520 family)
MAIPKLGFIGTGKVGTALATLFHQQGFPVTAVYNRTPQKAVALAKTVNAQIVDSPMAVFAHARYVFLTVADDAIEEVTASLKRKVTSKTVIHTSGAHSLDVLQSATTLGMALGSFHPSFPFAADTRSLNGATIAIEGSSEHVLQSLHSMALVIGGVPLRVPDGQKALYHAALCLCSNYTVTLYAIAERLLQSMGASKSQANHALNPLLKATMDNLLRVGIPDALTGPLVRNDVGTVAAHLAQLGEEDKRLYLQLANATLPLLEQRDVPTTDLVTLLTKESAT